MARRRVSVRWRASCKQQHLTLTFARQDPAQAMCPGLFHPMPRGRRGAMDIRYRHGDVAARVMGVQLGAPDLAVLLAVLAHCGVARAGVPAAPQGDLGLVLRRELKPRGAAEEAASAACRVGYRELARAAGMADGGRNREQMLDSLRRLMTVTVFQKSRDGVEWGSHILSFAADHATQKLVITVNHGATEALTGLRPTAYVSLPEHHALRGDTAKVLHHYLSAWIGPGHRQAVGLAALVRRVWPDPAPNPRTERKRRHLVREALRELTTLPGWRITEPRGGMYAIRRSRVLPEKSSHANNT